MRKFTSIRCQCGIINYTGSTNTIVCVKKALPDMVRVVHIYGMFLSMLYLYICFLSFLLFFFSLLNFCFVFFCCFFKHALFFTFTFFFFSFLFFSFLFLYFLFFSLLFFFLSFLFFFSFFLCFVFWPSEFLKDDDIVEVTWVKCQHTLDLVDLSLGHTNLSHSTVVISQDIFF